MLVARNQDKPGMIGQIGTLLGASKVNIATMQVSRNIKDGQRHDVYDRGQRSGQRNFETAAGPGRYPAS